jgi:DNA repair protein RadC
MEEGAINLSENIHSGHRDRLRNEVISADSARPSSPEKLLEMLLFYGIPRQDTAPIARELIARFGDLSGVLDADIESLVEVKGVTRNAASLIKLMLPISRSYVISKYKENDVLKNPDEIVEYLVSRYYGVEGECFTVLCLNRLGKVLSCEMISGGSDTVGISLRGFLERILRTEATAVAIAHNHPSGVALPSVQDVELTRQLKRTLDAVSINLLDHIIVADGDCVSMALSKEFDDIFGK